MKLEKFIISFAEQFDDIDAKLLNGATEFRLLEEWDSLIALSIMAMVDEEYGVKLKGDDIRSSSTIEDLFNVVKSRVK